MVAFGSMGPLCWSKVIPPKGSFSWVSRDYVDLHPTAPDVGIINRDGVRIWAGSEELDALHSYQQQVQLDKGDTVRILDTAGRTNNSAPGDLPPTDQNHYKILPPEGAYLWISSRFLEPVEKQPTADLDGDGAVGFNDLVILLRQWLDCSLANLTNRPH